MCGIAGTIGGTRSQLESLRAMLVHRGPDASGTHEDLSLGVHLAHVRFSILDLDARSHQPFQSPCGRFVLVFNGEIYNHVELRARLVDLGTDFRTTSDTEVLLHWILAHGAGGLSDLEGMYAFAFLDRARRTLLLARDPIGEKPLYYAFPSGSDAPSFAFASEIQPLTTLTGVNTELDEEALADWLRFLYTAAPRTLYRGIKELAPGHVLELDVDRPQDRPRRHYDLESRIPDFEGDARSTAVAFRSAFHDAVRLRLRSDVPVGVFLSAGLDSNAILAAARTVEPEARLETFTARWSGSREARERDESVDAAAAARFHGVPHHALDFGAEDDLASAAERIVHLFGVPFGNSTALVQDRLAREAARLGRVCLVGDGGDECLAGYPRHRALLLQRRLARLPGHLHGVASAIADLVPERGAHATAIRRARSFLQALGRPLGSAFLDWTGYVDASGLERALGPSAASPLHASLLNLFERQAADPLRAAALVDLASFVPFNLMTSADRAGMAHPLELRAPFLAPPLVELSLSIPAALKLRPGRTKPVLVDAIGRDLAPGIARRPKKPFNPPVRGWLAANLRELEDVLTGPRSELAHLLRPEWVRAELDGFRHGRRDNSTLLWGLVTLAHWARARSARTPDRAGLTPPGRVLPAPPVGARRDPLHVP